MSFIDFFEKLSIEKPKTFKRKVSSIPTYDKIVTSDMSSYIRQNHNLSGINIRPSVGQGNYADVPWICLLSDNASISPSPQKGLYIVLLFNKLGDSFYLTLGQGITNFNNMGLNSKSRNEIIDNTVKYFQDELKDDFINKHGFSMDPMDLGNDVSQLAKGYIKTGIISKRFDVSTFNEESFNNSLDALILEYNDIIDHIADKSYDDVISLINPNLSVDSVDNAIEELNEVLKSEYIGTRDVEQRPINVKRGALRSNKYQKLTRERIVKKTDYVKLAKEQYNTGLKGEQLVLRLERSRLLDLNLDPDEYIKWSASESDSYGYDIESVEYENGKLIKIYIEVKSSKDIKDTSFFISKKEVEVSKQKQNRYRVFRIFDITSSSPKYYVVSGEIEENFYLDPVTFSARYKYEVS